MNTILVVEDNPTIAAALTVRLRAAGYEVVTAGDGHNAILSAVSRKPDLIISDIWMPNPLGFLNRDRLHRLGLAEVPVIYITAHDDPETRASAEAAGCAAYFRKNDSGADVLETIRRLTA